jgi:hypothetical protein
MQLRTTLYEACDAGLGDLELNAIDSGAILKVVAPILERAPETGDRLISRVSRVFS